MDTTARIFITGHRGLVGGALVRACTRHGYTRQLVRTHAELDLCDQAAVRAFFAQERPAHVVVAAGRVGGIVANNTRRAEFIYDNLMIAANVIDAAYRCGGCKLLYLGSSCIYPRDCQQPMREEHLLSGPLEATNEPYAVAKIAGIKLVENYHRQYGCNFISAMPTNLYGENDNFDLTGSHVLPAMMRKFHEAKLAGHGPVTLWGSGACGASSSMSTT
jgi:GDP-L-fucose synthase